MPIPLMSPPEENAPRADRSNFYLVPQAKPASPQAPFTPRAVAHAFDILVVQGFSLYFSKVISLLLTSFHLAEIKGSGRMVAGRLFEETFAYGKGSIGVAAFLMLSILFLVVLPRFTGSTLGMGLMGIRFEGPSGESPGLKALFLRWAGCLTVYATGGLMLLPLLKRAPQPLFQDRLSNTLVVVKAAH